MTRRYFHLIAVSLIAFTSAAEARLTFPQLPPPDEAAHTAVHLPTGCIAMIVVSGSYIVKAEITDPLCLPKGVRARDVPGKMVDFTVTPDN